MGNTYRWLKKLLSIKSNPVSTSVLWLKFRRLDYISYFIRFISFLICYCLVYAHFLEVTFYRWLCHCMNESICELLRIVFFTVIFFINYDKVMFIERRAKFALSVISPKKPMLAARRTLYKNILSNSCVLRNF